MDLMPVKESAKKVAAMPDTMKRLVCNVGQQFGPHSGKQFRSPKYMVCGCDAGMCESHAVKRGPDHPFSPKYVIGTPKKCRKHSQEIP